MHEFLILRKMIFYLARSIKLQTVLYILPALISFFFFFTITERQIISGSTVPTFTTFGRDGKNQHIRPNVKYFLANGRSEPLFRITQGTLPCQPILGKNGKK